MKSRELNNLSAYIYLDRKQVKVINLEGISIMTPETNEKSNIHLINVPSENVEDIFRVAINSLNNGKNLLKYAGSVEIVIIQAQEFFVIPELGIAGSAIGKSCIEIKIDFSRKDLNKIIEVEIPATIYHELSHLVRENKLECRNTLLESMVSEGIACYIEKSVFSREIPYILPIKDEDSFWSTAKEFFDDSNYNHAIWFFGSGSLPKWIGYRLGYILVEKYMQKNNKVLSELCIIPSQEILFTKP